MSSSLLLSMDDDIVGIDVLNEDDDIDSIFDDGPTSIPVDVNSDINPIIGDKFNVLHYNVWSLMAEGRLVYLKMICHKYSIDVLIAYESKLDDTIPDNLIQINGFLSQSDMIKIAMVVELLFIYQVTFFLNM